MATQVQELGKNFVTHDGSLVPIEGLPLTNIVWPCCHNVDRLFANKIWGEGAEDSKEVPLLCPVCSGRITGCVQQYAQTPLLLFAAFKKKDGESSSSTSAADGPTTVESHHGKEAVGTSLEVSAMTSEEPDFSSSFLEAMEFAAKMNVPLDVVIQRWNEAGKTV